MKNAIETKDLTKVYNNNFTAVNSLDLEIPNNSIFGMLGPNGAGKTTTIKMLTCLIQPTSGKATVGGYDVEKNPDEVRNLLGMVPQQVSLYKDLTVMENSQMCADLLEEIDSFKKMYDCILIDEAQDFDKNFLQVCYRVIDAKKRLVYAYDELQSLNEEQMPSPEEIFGHSIENDTPLIVCYRNQGPVIVTAHAMGMGLYRKEGLVQLPGSADVWSAIGYISDKPVREGEEAILYRTKETSPDFLNVDKSEIIKFSKYKDAAEMYDAIFETISEDITTEQLTPRDIMIIDMDTLSYSNNYNKLVTYLRAVNKDRVGKGDTEYQLRIHIAGAASPEDFFREHSIVYSSVRRAKGNESFMVYIVNAHKCVNTIQRRTDRNALFTAITRSKGWVRVFGYGEDMQTLCDEFEKIREHDFKLYFEHYPTKAEQETIFLNNKDVEDRDRRAFDQTKELINRLSREGNISKAQLMRQLFDAETEELLTLLRESKNE